MFGPERSAVDPEPIILVVKVSADSSVSVRALVPPFKSTEAAKA
jgi:hypothetical protein